MPDAEVGSGWRIARRSSADLWSAVPRVFNPPELRSPPAVADWKSAIQQVGNLRYEARPTAVAPTATRAPMRHS
jgi:hypothetical protein